MNSWVTLGTPQTRRVYRGVTDQMVWSKMHVCRLSRAVRKNCPTLIYRLPASKNVLSMTPLYTLLDLKHLIKKAVHTFIVWELTLIRGSEREVHMAISSRVLMSGYLFLANSASNSWSCCEVKWVRCRLWRLSFTLFLLLLLLLFLPLFEFVDDLTWSLVSSSWLSGLSGLWLGSSDPGSEIEKQYIG
jgi:hypothetical protein